MRVVRLPILVLAAVSVACTPTDDAEGPADTAEPVAIREVTVPPERLTPFCQRMLQLDEELPADPAVDATDLIVAAYRDALPDAPDEIATELAAVLAALETGTEATLAPDPTPATDASTDSPTPDSPTTVPPSTPETAVPGASVPPGTAVAPPSAEEAFPEEGYDPDDAPGARVNTYIDFACRGTANNPGPAATQPDAAPPTTS